MDREKLRQIKRPNQVKVIFMNSCPLLSDLPMIIPTSQKGKKKQIKKQRQKILWNTSAVFRENRIYSAPCKAAALRWQGQLSSLTKRKASINYSAGFSSSLKVCIYCWTKLLSIELNSPCWHYLQTRLSRKRTLLAKKDRMETPHTFIIVGFFLPPAGTGFISYITF